MPSHQAAGAAWVAQALELPTGHGELTAKGNVAQACLTLCDPMD